MKKSDLAQIKKAIEEVALTKKDAKNFVTKDDLKVLQRGINAVNAHNIRIENKLDDMKLKFEKNLKQWKSEILATVSDLAGRTKTAEEENAILKAKEEGKDEIKEDHENRIKNLEKINPGNQHISA